MKKIINNLRGQSEEMRRHVLHVVIFVFAVLLLLLWVVSLNKTLTDKSTQVNLNQGLQPLVNLKASIVEGYKSITNGENIPQ